MAYSKDDIAAELKNRGIDAETGQPSSQTDVGRELEKRGIDPTGGLIGQLKTMGLPGYVGGLTKGAAMVLPRTAQIGAGAGQELQNLGLNIPGVKTGLAKIASLATQPFGGRGVTAAQVQPAQAIDPKSQQAQVGKLIGQAMAYGAPIGAAGRIGKLMGGVAPTVARIGAGLGTGAAYAPPGQRGIGALEMGGMAAVPEALGLSKKALSFAKGLSLNKYAKTIVDNLPATRNAENVVNNLGQGRTPEENSKNLALKIKGAKKRIGNYFTTKYNDIINRTGNESLYSKKELPDSYKSLYTKKKTVITSAEKFQGKALPVFKEVTEDIPKDSPVKTYSSDIKKAHQDFVKKPNFANAHKLQSVLGDEARRVLKNPLSNLQDKATAQGWEKAKGRVLNDMSTHLKNVDPSGSLAQEYKNIGEEYKNEAVPYKNKYITKVATGKVTNPRNLSTIFKNPESDIKKVVGDLGSGAKDQIVYNELYHRNPIAKNILNNYAKLEEKSIQSYASPKLEQQMQDLKTTRAQDEFLKHIGNKPTSKNIIKAADKLENKGLLRQLNPSLQDQIDILKGKATKVKWMKRGAGIAGALGGTYMAGKILPPYLRRAL